MRLSLFKKDDKFYLQIPDELVPQLSNGGEIELFPLKDGFYLLTSGISSLSSPSVSGGTKKQEEVPQSVSSVTTPSSLSLSPAERKLLHGLLTIQFKDRTPAHVKEVFKPEELAVLKELEHKGYVTVFYGTKYKNTGVYNIDDKIYPLLKEDAKGHGIPQTAQSGQIPTQSPSLGSSARQTPTSPSASGTQQSASQPSTVMSEILKRGYAIFATQGEAQRISDEIRKLPKGEVVGVKGFDGKFYVATKQYFSKVSELIQKNLKGTMPVSAIADTCKTDGDGCRSVLRIMADNGDVLEKKKDSFCLA